MEKETILISPKYKKSQKKILELNEKYKSIAVFCNIYTAIAGWNWLCLPDANSRSAGL